MTQPLHYRRSRFSASLPKELRYTRSHCWLKELEPDLWRVGFTRFATRMLGELVEFELDRPIGTALKLGENIGWIEGFKAISELYCVGSGALAARNPALAADVTLFDRDPHGSGWLYTLRGQPDPDAVDVQGYVAILDATIDLMLGHDDAADDPKAGP